MMEIVIFSKVSDYFSIGNFIVLAKTASKHGNLLEII